MSLSPFDGSAARHRLFHLAAAEAARLRTLAPDRLFLMPGVGAQGGAVGAIRAALDAHGGGVLPSASRSVLYAEAGEGFEKAAARVALDLKRQANDARAAVAGNER